MFLRILDKSDSVKSPNNQETASPTIGINALFLTSREKFIVKQALKNMRMRFVQKYYFFLQCLKSTHVLFLIGIPVFIYNAFCCYGSNFDIFCEFCKKRIKRFQVNNKECKPFCMGNGNVVSLLKNNIFVNYNRPC